MYWSHVCVKTTTLLLSVLVVIDEERTSIFLCHIFVSIYGLPLAIPLASLGPPSKSHRYEDHRPQNVLDRETEHARPSMPAILAAVVRD